jgi:hypothetical protein
MVGEDLSDRGEESVYHLLFICVLFLNHNFVQISAAFSSPSGVRAR